MRVAPTAKHVGDLVSWTIGKDMPTMRVGLFRHNFFLFHSFCFYPSLDSWQDQHTDSGENEHRKCGFNPPPEPFAQKYYEQIY